MDDLAQPRPQTVVVPDGNSVLLTGWKQPVVRRTESSPPCVSKIPYLNRLFRNVGMSKETETVMILVTPRIIILEEEEERLGIPSVAL